MVSHFIDHKILLDESEYLILLQEKYSRPAYEKFYDHFEMSVLKILKQFSAYIFKSQNCILCVWYNIYCFFVSSYQEGHTIP